MARTIDISARGIAGSLFHSFLALIAFAFRCHAAPPPLHALLVGGGPDKEYNTAEIEQHLRFVTSLVPPSAGRIVLFADGNPSSQNLSYTDSSHLTPAQNAMDVLLPNDQLGARVLTRAPQLGAPLAGPSRLGAIQHAFRHLGALDGSSAHPILLYFAGHGSVSRDEAKTSLYDLWGDDTLDPATLVREIDSLPPRIPVTLVMAQCFSGGFGNVLFQKGNPQSGLNERPITGFFAAESDREAAGCGTETSSPSYQDFSSYFFGALSGRDKLGHVVQGADFDGDGKVGCYEAWCYALIHDDSIDTPICTSLVFLRRFADAPDADVYNASYQDLLAMATPAERAALDALSRRLGLEGEHRLLAAYDRLMFSDPIAQSSQVSAYRTAQEHLNALRMDDLHLIFQKWPALRWRDSGGYDRAVRGAQRDLEKNPPLCQSLLTAQDAYDHADDDLDNEEARLVRFTDVAELIVRRHYLHDHGDATTKTRFELLWKAEQQPLPIILAGH